MKVTAEHLTLPRDGERVNGDAVLVRLLPEYALFAVIDALGHGPIAAEVARVATEYLTTAPIEGGLTPIMQGLHARLHGTRGAAAMVCLLIGTHLDGCGVGNVELRGCDTRVPTVLTPGILGGTTRRFRLFEAKLGAGDRLVLFSDGVSSRLDLGASRSLSPRQACDAIMSQNRRLHDDSTVLVIDLEA